MAFGYRPLGDTGRHYQNEATGEIITRTRYKRIIDNLLAEHVAEETQLGGDAIRETAQHLADLQDILRRRQVAARPETQGRQSAGLRRRNALLESYYESERLRGSRKSKAELGRSAEFKQIIDDMKGRPNPRHDPNIKDDNRVRRSKALDQVGGDAFFRRQYEKLYGGRKGGHGPQRPRRRDSKGNPTTRRRR